MARRRCRHQSFPSRTCRSPTWSGTRPTVVPPINTPRCATPLGARRGMSRAEIRKKFDEIVDFADVEKFLDTPVKRYSSGMYVRLAFAVAAHLEPEILIVDEVLAVGDAEFQKKCLGKMNEVSRRHGRTVLFVSHNMAALSELTNKAIHLENGSLVLED